MKTEALDIRTVNAVFDLRMQNLRSITNGVDLGRATSELLSSPWMLLVLKVTIGVVSAYDIFLTIKYVEFLPSMELNPIGRWLMDLDSGPECGLDQIACFVASKFAGNFLTLATIELVGHWRRAMATTIALAVAIAQLFLMYFLLAN